MGHVVERNAWVVYRITTLVNKTPIEVNAVCEQDEWEVLQRTKPGLLTLVRERMASEGEAEKLARGASGNPIPRRAGARPSERKADLVSADEARGAVSAGP